MAHHLALFTFGVFIERSEHPVNDGFHQRNDPILEAVEQAPGFVARSGYADEPGPEPWGEQVFPRFYEERGDGWSPATLSLWQDLESAMAFSYHGLHAEALAHGREWFRAPEWPPYALWWVAAGHRPDWTEAVARHEALHLTGASPRAFTFRLPFGPAGQRIEIDPEKVRAIALRTPARPS